MLIVFEGADGCGKDTIADEMAKHFMIDKFSFPDRSNSSPTGKLIRAQLRRGVTCPTSFQALQTINRFEHFEILEMVSGSLFQHLILVRYWQSSWVYGSLDGLDQEWLLQISAQLPSADLNILIDVPPEVLLQRRALREKRTIEHYEDTNLDAKVVELYRRLWREEHEDGVFVDGNRPLHAIVEEVKEIIKKALP